MDVNIAVLVDAKKNIQQLQNILTGQLCEGLLKYLMNQTKDSKKYFKLFQDNLSAIPNWNQNILEAESERIINNCNCSWIDELLTAIFVSNVRILTAVRTNNKKPDIDLRVPSFNQFLHKCYHECERIFKILICLMKELKIQRNKKLKRA